MTPSSIQVAGPDPLVCGMFGPTSQELVAGVYISSASLPVASGEPIPPNVKSLDVVAAAPKPLRPVGISVPVLHALVDGVYI